MKNTLIKISRSSALAIAAVLLVTSVFYRPATGQTVLAIGAEMPMKDHGMVGVSDETSTVASVKGENGTVVVFWCNTCPWVKRYEDRFVDIASRFGENGFGFVAVNPNDAVAYPGDNLDEMKKQAADGGYSFPYLVDAGSEMAVAYGAKRTPQVYVFDANDLLVYQGAIDDSPADAGKVKAAYLTDALAAVADGSDIQPDETKAFGCTIKFQ